MCIGALTSASVGWLSNQTAIPMSAVMAACAVTALSILLLGRKIIRYQTQQAVVEQESVDDVMMS